MEKDNFLVYLIKFCDVKVKVICESVLKIWTSYKNQLFRILEKLYDIMKKSQTWVQITNMPLSICEVGQGQLLFQKIIEVTSVVENYLMALEERM